MYEGAFIFLLSTDEGMTRHCDLSPSNAVPNLVTANVCTMQCYVDLGIHNLPAFAQ